MKYIPIFFILFAISCTSTPSEEKEQVEETIEEVKESADQFLGTWISEKHTRIRLIITEVDGKIMVTNQHYGDTFKYLAEMKDGVLVASSGKITMFDDGAKVFYQGSYFHKAQ
jgi:hypothetical protein